jgi:S-adenosylmethionine uptake transporter
MDSASGSFRDLLRVVLVAIAGWACFCCVDMLTKYLTLSYDFTIVVGLTAPLGLLLSGSIIFFRDGFDGFRSPRWRWHVARGVNVMFTTMCVVNAVARIPLTDFYGLVFIAPILLMLLSVPLLGEKIGWRRLMAALVGFGGVLIIAGPQFQHYNSGILFSLAAAVFVANNGLIVRKIGREPKVLLFAFFPCIFNSLVYLPFVISHFTLPHLGEIPVFLAVPPCVLSGLTLYSWSMSRASEVAVVAPFHYTQILWGALFGWFIFGDVPAATTVAGAMIVVGAGLYIIWREYCVRAAVTPPPAESVIA